MGGVVVDDGGQPVEVGVEFIPGQHMAVQVYLHGQGRVGPGQRAWGGGGQWLAVGAGEFEVQIAVGGHRSLHLLLERVRAAQVAQGEGHAHGAVGQVGHHAVLQDAVRRARLQLYPSHNAVPVALCLVGHAVRVLSHAHILYAVVYLDGYCVVSAETHIVGDVVLMCHAQAHAVSHLQPVHVEGGFNMRSLQVEHHAALAPVFGYVHAPPVPCVAHIVAVGRQAEGQFHLSCLAVALHVGVEEERRVVDARRPAGVCGHRVALAVGEHGAWQFHPLVQRCVGCPCALTVYAEVPGAAQVDVLRTEWAASEEKEHEEPCRAEPAETESVFFHIIRKITDFYA